MADVSGGRSTPTPDEPVREWCCRTPLTVPHVPGCSFEPRPDNPIDYSGPVVVARPPVGDTTPDTKCECGGFIGWTEYDDRWEGSCYGQCGGYPIIRKPLGNTTQPQPTDEGNLEILLPFTVIEDANGDVWQKRQRRYGSSWYQPGDSQPHGAWDIAQPVTVIRQGREWSDDC